MAGDGGQGANGRVQPRTPLRVELGGEWSGWELTVDGDLTLGQLDGLFGGEHAQIRAALADMLIEWNFVGKRGEPLAADGDGMQGVGARLFRETLRAVRDAFVAPKADAS